MRNEIFDELFIPKSSLNYGLKKCKIGFLSHDLTLLSKMQEGEVEWQTDFVFTLFSREIGVKKLSPFSRSEK